MEYYSVDQLSGGRAVLLSEEEQPLTVPLEALARTDPPIREGETVVLAGGVWVRDDAETARRRALNAALLARVLHRSPAAARHTECETTRTHENEKPEQRRDAPMPLSELYAQKPCVFSIEVFPPKKESSLAGMQAALSEMAALRPDFISVTCSAGGSGRGGISTCQIARFIKNDLGLEPLAHITCMGASEAQLRASLTELRAAGIQNLLALRGDRFADAPPSAFAHADELMRFVRAEYSGFGLGGACYPEGHPESESLAADMDALRKKQEAGAGHLVTQLFFENLQYYRFLNRARKAGIRLPVSAGVMPIVSTRQIERTVKLSSASLPPAFTKMISRWQDDEQGLFEAGIEYAVAQLRDLIEGGADGVHLYAMNNPLVARRVYEGIADLLPGRGGAAAPTEKEGRA